MSQTLSYCHCLPSSIDIWFAVNFITSAKEGMFSPGFVYGFVSVFVSKVTQKLMDRF